MLRLKKFGSAVFAAICAGRGEATNGAESRNRVAMAANAQRVLPGWRTQTTWTA